MAIVIKASSGLPIVRIAEKKDCQPPPDLRRMPIKPGISVLQLVQGMYFREVALTETIHRHILYTNLRAFGERDAHDLVIGRFLPSTTYQGIGSLTIEARERLEGVTLQGQPEVLVATSGHQLVDEIAAVTAFCMNVVCVRDYDMARRLISRRAGDTQDLQGPAGILRQTFDAHVVLSDERLADLDSFLRKLIGLRRKSYEAAIRAIRQIVDATMMVGEDATLAYTLMVAALESLGQATEPEAGSWADYDEQKRARIDAATDGLEDDRREQIRSAILANEHGALKRRFVAFVLDHVEPSFFRSEAVGALRPIAAHELPNALRDAYDIRSRNVHALQYLAPEVWMTSDRADTSEVEDALLLSLEGLSRLSRHVVRRFVERAPKGVDKKFQYRSVLPGLVRGKFAPQYWIHQAEGFSRKSAPAFLDGMIDLLIEGMSGRSEHGLVPMDDVLIKIEKTMRGLKSPADRLPMAAIMTIWNSCAPDDRRRKLKTKFQKQMEEDLAPPSIVSFALAMILNTEISWTPEEYQALADARRVELQTNIFQPMPKRIDALLHILLANHYLSRDDREAGLIELAHAVEAAPGLAELVEFENAIRQGEDPRLDRWKFMLGEAEFLQRDEPAPQSTQ